MEPRHKFGNLTLLLALASLTLGAFSLGSVWATAEDSHVTEVYDPDFETVDVTVVTLTADFELKEIESVLTIQDTYFFGSSEASPIARPTRKSQNPPTAMSKQRSKTWIGLGRSPPS